MKQYYIFNDFIEFNLFIDEKIHISLNELKTYLEPYIYIEENNNKIEKKDLDIIVSSKVSKVTYEENVLFTNYNGIISLKRLINDLANRIIESKNGIFLHASSIELDGYSYLFIGEKGSGKTTTMLNLLSNNLANYSSNERTALIHRFNGLVSYGNLSSINIRANTLKYNEKLLNKLLPIIDETKYNLYANQNLNNDCKERLAITYKDLEAYLRVKICPVVKTKAIINLVNKENIDFHMEQVDFNSFENNLKKNKINGVFETRSYLEDMIKIENKSDIDILNTRDIYFYNLYKNNSKDISLELVKRLKYERNN